MKLISEKPSNNVIEFDFAGASFLMFVGAT